MPWTVPAILASDGLILDTKANVRGRQRGLDHLRDGLAIRTADHGTDRRILRVSSRNFAPRTLKKALSLLNRGSSKDSVMVRHRSLRQAGLQGGAPWNARTVRMKVTTGLR